MPQHVHHHQNTKCVAERTEIDADLRTSHLERYVDGPKQIGPRDEDAYQVVEELGYGMAETSHGLLLPLRFHSGAVHLQDRRAQLSVLERADDLWIAARDAAQLTTKIRPIPR